MKDRNYRTGDCNFVPANDARVFFASWNGKPISPYEYTDFESLAWYLKVKILQDTDHKKHERQRGFCMD